MKRLADHDAPATWQSSQVRRIFGVHTIVLLLILLIAGLVGCAPKKEETPSSQPVVEESVPGPTNPINTNWDQTNNCVSFVPENREINVGDPVNFGTSMDSVRITVQAGLFSVGDTTFLVVRGANSESPTARAIGTYRLTSTPAACASTQGGGGPSIIVGTGTGNP